MEISNIRKNGFLLGLFALLTTSIIAGTYLGTKDAISERQREAKLKALKEILNTTDYNNDLLSSRFDIFDKKTLGHREKQYYIVSSLENHPTAIIIPATAQDGYSGDIDLIAGINTATGEIIGVRIIAHKETPGLGDKIETRKSDWILSFNGHSLQKTDQDGWRVKKDGGVFDSFTGATVTPRAAVAAIHRILQYYQQHQDTLLDTRNKKINDIK